MHNIEGVVSDGEFKVRGRSNGPIPSLTNTLRNVGVTWMCEAIRSTLSKRPPRQGATFIEGTTNESKQSVGCVDAKEVVQNTDCHAERC
jgi:hypothetical protein